MKLKLEDFVFRSWNYFRQGYSTYLSFIVGFFTFVSTTYYLAIRSIPFLEEIFPSFYVFVTVGIIVFVPLGVLIGWLHMKGTLAYPTDVAITYESNPYLYKIAPGKEKEISYPLWAILSATLQKLLEKEDILTPEEKREFEDVRDKIQRLREGKIIGEPRQRRMLAVMEKEGS